MANRHLARSIALQSLFEWDARGYATEDLAGVILRNVAEFGPGLEDDVFIKRLVSETIDRKEKLDLIIAKAAPDWPIEQIAMIDRNVLRLGLCELLFSDHKEVPARVAINEAIELAKTFGGDNSGKFVNGVLGAIYKEMGEPGKDDVPAKKKRPRDIPYEQMPVEKLGGAVVYCRENGQIFLALVHDMFGYWTLSKGHLNQGEETGVGVAREIKEEMSLTVRVLDHLADNEYISSDPEKGKLRKQVSYFLAEAEDKNSLKLTKSGGLDDARWFDLSEIAGLKMYDDVVPFVTKAIRILSTKK
ncbi:transcription antitermination factor NusB [Candidatus Nomurabacteria bacterium]|nr:transcription antitermination factor NusB [Candidatus Nomurabacteria bacterium]